MNSSEKALPEGFHRAPKGDRAEPVGSPLPAGQETAEPAPPGSAELQASSAALGAVDDSENLFGGMDLEGEGAVASKL